MATSLSERMASMRRGRRHPDEMSLGEHLAELRRRLVVAVVAFVLLACVAAFFYNWEFALLRHPYCAIHQPGACRFYVTAPLDALSLRVKLAAFGGLVLASPVMLWELWRFITPGLRPTEKRYAIPFVLLLMVLFGLTFEFPVVLVALQLARVVTPRALLRHWRWAVIGITVASAVFTPSSDPFSMIALAVPLVAFYFGAIGVGKLLGR